MLLSENKGRIFRKSFWGWTKVNTFISPCPEYWDHEVLSSESTMFQVRICINSNSIGFCFLFCFLLFLFFFFSWKNVKTFPCQCYVWIFPACPPLLCQTLDFWQQKIYSSVSKSRIKHNLSLVSYLFSHLLICWNEVTEPFWKLQDSQWDSVEFDKAG